MKKGYLVAVFCMTLSSSAFASDEEIYRIRIKKDVKIASSKEAPLSGNFSINQFMTNDSRLKELPKSDVKVEVDIRKVVLSDNTIVEAK